MRIVAGRACFSLTSTLFSRGRQANDSGRSRPDAWHGAYQVGSFGHHQAPVSGSAQRRRPTPPCPPPSVEPETGSGRADRVGSVRTTGKNRHTGPGRQLKQGLSWARGICPKTQSLRCIQRPKVHGHRPRRRRCRVSRGSLIK